MNDIYDHAPECDVAIWLERAIETDAPRWLGIPDDVACQCVKLRACEERVREEESRNVIGSVSLAAIGEANLQQYQLGFATGLDAAQEAVERVSSLLQPLGPALAAIDALRGSGNPDTPPSAEKGEKP